MAKFKLKYWLRTHKLGIRILKNVNKTLAIDCENHNNLWRNAIAQEMKNVHVAFEEYGKSQGPVPPGYKQLDCHMIFDVNMNKNFRRKAQMVADGHNTEAPASITYLLVVSYNSVHIALTIAALNKLKIQACDIQNAYLTTP